MKRCLIVFFIDILTLHSIRFLSIPFHLLITDIYSLVCILKSSSDYPVNSLTSQNTKMGTSTEKQLPVNNRSCNLLSKAVKRVDKFQQTCQPEIFSNLDLVSKLNLLETNGTSCQTDFQSEIGRPRRNEADHLISALNKHIQSLEKQLDENQ